MKTHSKLYKLPSPWERGWGRGLIALCLLTLTATSCKKDKNQPRYETNVYVVGSVWGGTDVPYATIWKNGEVTHITDGTNSAQAQSVYVSGTDVYVSGQERNGANMVAKVWKNGEEEYILSDGPTPTSARSIAVSGANVYVVASSSRGSGSIWKNGELLWPMGGLLDLLSIQSVFASGDDVYMAGSTLQTFSMPGGPPAPPHYFATVEKIGGSMYQLTDGNQDAEAYSVYVSGGDVYTAGYESNGTVTIAKVWKNDQELYALTDGTQPAYAYSVFVSGDDVYVAGREHSGTKWVAKVWKNGNALYNLNGANGSEAYSVYVVGNDVYVAGMEENEEYDEVARIWKNGVMQKLTEQSSVANSIFVVQREI